MKVFTQEEYNAIERDEFGIKHLPEGDYTQVVLDNGRHAIDAGCKFGAGREFGDWCKFNGWCEFGAECKFGDECEFGDWCKFGAGCEFGDLCKFGDECEFGGWCKFGARCRLGAGCEFGQFFIQGKNTSFESGAVKNGTFVKVGRIGSEMRDVYFFIDENGKFFVRAGCWFSDMDEFIERVHEVHGGTRHERQYLAACEYAKAVLPEMLEEVNR